MHYSGADGRGRRQRLLSWSGWVPLAVTAWAVAFLWGEGSAALMAAPLAGAAAATIRRPWLATTLLGAAGGVTLFAGVPYGGLELVAASAYVLVCLGQHEEKPWSGLVAAALVAGTSAVRDDLSVRSVLVTGVVFGSMWLFGRLVRHRVWAARRAVAEAEQWAATDPVERARALTEQERRGVAAGAAVDLRRAVQDMVAGLDEVLAAEVPDGAAIGEVRERGARTVAALRRLLVLLRQEPEPEPVPGPRRQSPSPWPLDLTLAALAAVVSLLTLWRMPHWAATPWIAGAHLAVVAAIALRRRDPLIASALLVAAMAPLVVGPPSDPDALLLIAGGIVAVLWSLVDRGTAGWVAAGVTAVVAIALGARFGVDGAGFVAVVLFTGVAAGRAWREPDLILRRAREQSAVLRAELARQTAAAVRQERLRIARDLHDATSHAVGVMVMQVSAAQAQLAGDPVRAREALETARAAGEQARVASNPLLPAPVEGPGAEAVLCAELEALVAQWRACEMAVTARVLGPFPVSPQVAGACYRVVQEALTNAARHAPGAYVDVRVAVQRRWLVVEVSDDGARGPVESTTGSGTGLAGLRERVADVQGEWVAGPTGRGFRVTARLPTDAVSGHTGRPAGRLR